MLSVNDDVFDEIFIPNGMSPIFNKYNMYDILNMTTGEIATLLHNNYIDILTERSLASKMNFVTFNDMLKDNEIKPKRLDFPTYNNNENGTVDIQYNGELNLFTIGIEILKAKKKTEKESDEIMGYFGKLMKNVIEKENEPIL
jgi:ABC-type transporter MlaC component